MTVRILRLGTPRLPGEGLRIGTVRRPPRGVPKTEFAARNWYDLWFPLLAPSLDTLQQGRAARTEAQWRAFRKKYRAEMAAPGAAQPPGAQPAARRGRRGRSGADLPLQLRRARGGGAWRDLRGGAP